MKLCGFDIGVTHPFFLIAGPCVIESRDLVMEVATKLDLICTELDIHFIFKASYDKANRSSADSFRGPGLERGLQILADVRESVGIPVLTDVHTVEEVQAASHVVDVLQIPAFLCRQTDLLKAAADTGYPVNIKKGQFMAPWDMQNVVDKMGEAKAWTMITERGSSFGYNQLVVDMRSLAQMRATGCPIIFDAGHSCQTPGGGKTSGGDRVYIADLARAAVAVGVSGVFIETHPNPDKALSDGPNSFPLESMRGLLSLLKRIDHTMKSMPES